MVEEDGTIQGMNLDTKNYTDKLDISVAGTTPTGGYLNYENNVLKDGCLTMDEYKVTIENGEVTTAEKGSCENISLTACDSDNFNPSPEEWFNFDSSTGTITGLSDAWNEITDPNINKTDITIPCQINGVGVVNIGAGSLYGKNSTSLIIGDSVTTILGGSFFNNQLKTVILGDNVKTIEGGTFNNNQLISLYLGKNLETIGPGAFANNQLKEVIIPDKVTNIGPQAFFANSMEKLTLGKSVKTIGNSSFLINFLTEVTIPESVTNIDIDAFSGNMLTTVTIYGKDIEIAKGAFKKFIDGNYSVDGKIYDNENANLTTIYNNTGKSFDWELIINGTSEGKIYEEGTVVNELGNVEIKKSS